MVLFESEVGFGSFLTNKNGSLVKVGLGTLAAFVLCILGYAFVAHMQPQTYLEGGASPWMYRLTQPFIISYYFMAWFAPIKLNADTDWVVFSSALDPYAILGYCFLIFAVVTMFITSEYKNTRPIAFGLAWFFLAVVPTSITPFSEVTNDHRMFFPFVGLSLAIVWALYLLVMLVVKNVQVTMSMKVTFYALLVVILMGFAYGTHERNKVWRNDDNLWLDCTLKSPTNGRGLMNYGLALMRKGDYAGAEKYFSRGLEYWPYYAYLHVNMAILKDAMGHKAEAENYFQSGIALAPAEAGDYFFYARFLKKYSRKDEAIATLYKCLSLVDSRMEARSDLTALLYEQKRMEEVKAVAKRTLELAPGDAQATMYLQMAATGKSQLELEAEKSANYKTPQEFLNLSLLYYNAKNYQGCIDAAQKAIKLKPDFAEAYNNICSAYNAMGKFEEGAKACEAALKINAGYTLAQNNLKYAKSMMKK